MRRSCRLLGIRIGERRAFRCLGWVDRLGAAPSLFAGATVTTHVDFTHTSYAEAARYADSIKLARYIWDRGICGTELLSLSGATRRALAKAAVVNPPCTSKRWATVADLVAEQSAWADAHPDDPGSVPLHADEHEAWISWIRPASEIGTSRG